MFLKYLQTSFFHRPRDNQIPGCLGCIFHLFHIFFYFPWNIKEGPRKDVIEAVLQLVHSNDFHVLCGWKESSANLRALGSRLCLLVMRNSPGSQGLWPYLGYGDSSSVVLMLSSLSVCGCSFGVVGLLNLLGLLHAVVWTHCWTGACGSP